MEGNITEGKTQEANSPNSPSPTIRLLGMTPVQKCCVRCGPGGELTVDVVPGGTEFELQVKKGSSAGRRHSQ